MRACVLLGTALAALVLAQSARAAETPADAALAHGVELRRERKDEEALAEFRRAYELQPSPRALAQIALAEAAIGRWVAAESDLLRALAASDDDPWIARQREPLSVAWKEIATHLGTLDVEGREGAELWIDGAIVGRLPAPRMRVPAKHLVVELRAEGFTPSRGEVDVEPGGTANLALSLAPAPPPPPSQESADAQVAARRQRTLAWASAGGAALFLAGGIIATAYTANRLGHYDDDAECGDLPGNPRSARCSSYASQFHVGQTLEVIGFVAAGVAAGTSAVLFLTLPHARGTQARAWLVPSLGGVRFSAAF